jgi:hypothetical protein
MEKIEWLKTVAFPEIKADPKNKNKGLIPRFHQQLSDRFYGGTKESLSKICNDLATDGTLFKAFVKFKTSDSDKIDDGKVVEGPHKGMKLSKDGRLSTPIYWLTDDPEIPTYFKNQNNRAEAYRMGQKEFGNTDIM